MDRSVLILRAEGLALGCAATALYATTGVSWWLFAPLALVPDLFMAGYALGPRIGAAIYNAVHSTLAPLTLAALAYGWGATIVLAVALVWLAHVGFDRALGYGLKLPEGFRHTHLGTVGGADGDAAYLRKQST